MKSYLALCAAAAALATPAGAVNVKSIKITNAFPTWLQVSEVVATQAGTDTDVALETEGAVATGSSTWDGDSLPANAIDGVGPAAFPAIFHSGTSDSSAWLLVTLADTFNLSSLSIYGRTDCCSERDLFNYTLFDAAGNVVGSGQIDATNGAHFGTAALGAVPEPASWAMMVGGFGLIGGAMRRRRAAVAFA